MKMNWEEKGVSHGNVACVFFVYKCWVKNFCKKINEGESF